MAGSRVLVAAALARGAAFFWAVAGVADKGASANAMSDAKMILVMRPILSRKWMMKRGEKSKRVLAAFLRVVGRSRGTRLPNACGLDRFRP